MYSLVACRQLYQVYLNLDNADLPFFKDLEIRRALYMGINRQWMIDRLLAGQGILANGADLPRQLGLL